MLDRSKDGASHFWLGDLWKDSRNLHLGWVLEGEYVFVRPGRWGRAPRQRERSNMAYSGNGHVMAEQLFAYRISMV